MNVITSLVRLLWRERRGDGGRLLLAGLALAFACALYPPPRWIRTPWMVPGTVSYLPPPAEVAPKPLPVIILAYPGAPPANDPFRGFAEAFADTFRPDDYHDGYQVVTLACDVETPQARQRSVCQVRRTCARFRDRRIIAIAWSAAAWPTEVAALEGARVSRLVVIGGVHDFTDQALSPLVRPYYQKPQADTDLSPMRRDLSRLPPTLLLHSATDTFVPPAHARRFYERAKVAGRPVMLRYLSTPEHAPGKAAGRRVYHDAIAAWFAQGA